MNNAQIEVRLTPKGEVVPGKRISIEIAIRGASFPLMFLQMHLSQLGLRGLYFRWADLIKKHYYTDGDGGSRCMVVRANATGEPIILSNTEFLVIGTVEARVVGPAIFSVLGPEIAESLDTGFRAVFKDGENSFTIPCNNEYDTDILGGICVIDESRIEFVQEYYSSVRSHSVNEPR